MEAFLRDQAVALQLGLLAIITASLFHLLLRPLCIQGTPFGRCVKYLCVPHDVNAPLCFAPLRVLPSDGRPSQGGRRAHRTRGRAPACGLLTKAFCACIHAVLGSTPVFGPAPAQLPLGVYALWIGGSPPLAAAMARPEPTGEDSPLVARPHELPASSLASFMGSNQVHIPWTDARPVSASTCQLPLADNADGRTPSGWLGVQVFTPHARPMYVGVQADKARGVQGAIDLVAADLRDLPQGLYDTVLPLRPQRHPGYLSLLRFPSIVGDPRWA